jgi:hypothetical protein
MFGRVLQLPLGIWVGQTKELNTTGICQDQRGQSLHRVTHRRMIFHHSKLWWAHELSSSETIDNVSSGAGSSLCDLQLFFTSSNDEA